MRFLFALLVPLVFATPAFAADQIACSQVPAAQRYIDGLKPGPNTRAAQQHLDAAKAATSDQNCVNELGQANYYAKRSAAADARGAHTTRASARVRARPRRVLCADAMHEDRPGGTDYHGAPVAGCRQL